MSFEVKEEIRDELSSFGVDGDNETIEQLSLLATCYKMEAREISDEWIAHVYSKNVGSSYTVKESLAIFNDKLKSIILCKNNKSALPAPSLNLSGVLSDKNPSQMHVLQTSLNKNNLSFMSDEENDELMSIYGITPIQPKKSRTNVLLNLDTNIASPIILGKIEGSMQSPIVLASSQSQKISGEVLALFYNKHFKLDSSISPQKTTLDFQEKSLTTISKPTQCYMNQPLKSKAIAINKNIIAIADAIKNRFDLQFEQYHPIFLPSSLAKTSEDGSSNTCVYIRGRICSQKVDGKLSHTHIYLEGCLDVSKGKRVQLFFSNPTVEYSLFPGQVVIAYGFNDPQEKEVFHVNNIYYETILSNVGDVLSLDQLNTFKSTQCNIFVVTGPFIVVDPNKIKPIEIERANANTYIKYDFLQQLYMLLESKSVKTLILTGPFITIENDQLATMHPNNGCIFSQLYGQFFSFLNSVVKKFDMDQLVLVPSNQDLYTTHIYPLISTTTGSFFTSLLSQNNINISDKIIFASCPTTFKLNNGLSCCVTGVDTLHHLSSFEVNKLTQSCDRISRLIQHCFYQQSLYPLYPSYQKMNLDVQMNRIHGKPQNNHGDLPHVLIMPSNLKYFLKNVNGCLVVNPGKFAQGHSLGSYSRLSLNVKIIQDRVAIDKENSIAEIIKL